MKCCDVEAGKLRHPIELQAKESTPDGIGGFATQWVTYRMPWAWIRPTSGNETLVGGQIQAAITHDVVIRYIHGVQPDDRVLFGIRTFNIRAIINVEERNRWLQLRCEEGVGILQESTAVST
jgi:SPP1 family predicted phage head-tail adaptor